MPTFIMKEDGSIALAVHDTAQYLYEFLNLPEFYLSSEEKNQILCQNFWDFLGMTKRDVISSNRKIILNETEVECEQCQSIPQSS